MRQISSKLNIYLKSLGAINNNIEKLAFNIIIWSFGLLALFYVLFLGNMVKDIIARRSLETSVNTLSSEVRELESIYLSISNNVDLTLSYSMDFEEPKTAFTTKKPIGLRQGESFGNIK